MTSNDSVVDMSMRTIFTGQPWQVRDWLRAYDMPLHLQLQGATQRQQFQVLNGKTQEIFEASEYLDMGLREKIVRSLQDVFEDQAKIEEAADRIMELLP